MYPLCVRTWFLSSWIFCFIPENTKCGWKILSPRTYQMRYFVTACEGLVTGPSMRRHQAPNIEHHPKGMHISGCSTTTWEMQRHCVGHHALKSSQQSPPQKKNTEHWDRSFVGRRFFEDGGTFFCVKTCPFNEPSLPTNWWRISTPTSKFFVIKIISNAFCRQTIPLGSLRAIKLETATAGARWPPWGFWWLSAWCFSCQFLINNPFPRGCLGEQKRKR